MTKREIISWIDTLKKEPKTTINEKRIQLLQSLLVELKTSQKIYLHHYKNDLTSLKSELASSWYTLNGTSIALKLKLTQTEAILLDRLLTRITDFDDILKDL